MNEKNENMDTNTVQETTDACAPAVLMTSDSNGAITSKVASLKDGGVIPVIASYGASPWNKGSEVYCADTPEAAEALKQALAQAELLDRQAIGQVCDIMTTPEGDLQVIDRADPSAPSVFRIGTLMKAVSFSLPDGMLPDALKSLGCVPAAIDPQQSPVLQAQDPADAAKAPAADAETTESQDAEAPAGSDDELIAWLLSNREEARNFLGFDEQNMPEGEDFLRTLLRAQAMQTQPGILAAWKDRMAGVPAAACE